MSLRTSTETREARAKLLDEMAAEMEANFLAADDLGKSVATFSVILAVRQRAAVLRREMQP